LKTILNSNKGPFSNPYDQGDTSANVLHALRGLSFSSLLEKEFYE